MVIEKPKILIVDDNRSNIELVEVLLKHINAELTSVTSGEEAIEQTNTREFALVLMDISMPGLDGFQTVERIRLRKENRLLNVIYMTAYNDELNMQIRGVQTGAVDFITKPVNRELFLGKVNICLALYRQRKCLEMEIRRRTEVEKELILAREAAEEAGRAKQRFLSVMTHEIRTPLNAILNTTHLLMETGPRPDQKDHFGILRFSADSMVQLVNQVLDYSKIDAGKVEFESSEFDIRELIGHITQSLDSEAVRKGLRFETVIDDDVPPVIIGDCSRLMQIIMNLEGNAVKFTESGKVSLSVKVRKDFPEAVELQFDVTDTGIGIPADQLERIFDSFTQANPTITRYYGGTGLGLAITRMLVEGQGGQLNVSSTPGMGSTFSFSIMFGKSTKTQLPGPLPINMEYRSLNGARVLVAEDNVVNQKIILKILSKWNASPDLAENGKVAVQKVCHNHYDLVLMDLYMPVMNGYDATLAIRKTEGDYYRDLPILALTATAFEEDRSKFALAGMNGYILKPFTPPELYKKISYFLK